MNCRFLVLAVAILGASRCYAQAPEPEWLPIESVGGKVTIGPVADLPPDVPKTGAVHVEIAPGLPFSGLVSNGTWLSNALGPGPWSGIGFRIRVLSGEPITFTCLWPGGLECELRAGVGGHAWQPVVVPGGRRLLLLCDQPYAFDMASFAPLRADSPRVGMVCGASDALSLLRDAAREGWRTGTLREDIEAAWEGLSRYGQGAERLNDLADKALDLATLCFITRPFELAARQQLARLQAAGATPCTQGGCNERLLLRIGQFRRAMAVGGSPAIDSILASVGDCFGRGRDAALAGLPPLGLSVRDGVLICPGAAYLLPTADPHAAVPFPALAEAMVGTQDGLDLECASCDWQAPPQSAVSDLAARQILANGAQRDRLCVPLMVKLSHKPDANAVPRMSPTQMAIEGDQLAGVLGKVAAKLKGCRALAGYAVDLSEPTASVFRDQRTGVSPGDVSAHVTRVADQWKTAAAKLSGSVLAADPGAVLLLDTPDPPDWVACPGSPDIDWSFLSAFNGPAGSTALIRPARTGLEARFAAAGPGSGPRTTGVRACNLGIVERPGFAMSFSDLLQSTGTSTRPRIAVVASHVEIARRSSNAPALLSLLAQMGVDADLLCDLTLRDDPELQHRHKALVYETNSLDPRAFKTVWSSGVPTLFVGRLNEDSDQRGLPAGAAAALMEQGVFLKSPPVCWLNPSENLVRRPGGPPVTEDDPLGTLPPVSLGPKPRGRPELAERGWQCVSTSLLGSQSPPPADSTSWAWWLRIADGLPPQTEVLINGQPVGRVDARLPRVDAFGNYPFTARVPVGLLKGTAADVITLRLPPKQPGRDRQPVDLGTTTLTPAAVHKMKPTADFGDLRAAEEYEYLTGYGQVRLHDEILAPGATVLARDTTTQAPVLLRQGNSMLWAGPDTIEHTDAVALRVVSSFLAMLGEAHTYPPQVTGTNDVRESALGYVITRQTSDYVEANLGTNRALYAVLGDDAAWQRVGGDARSIVPLPAWHCAETIGLRKSEIEVRPISDPVTVTRLERDFCRPELLSFVLHVSGAAQLVLHTPFATGTEFTGLVDDTPQRLVRRGDTATLTVPAGEHDVRFEAFSRDVEAELAQRMEGPHGAGAPSGPPPSP